MVYISCKEPKLARFIYINHETNKVHLMTPVVGGQEISTDNTCQSTQALKDFFDGGALAALKAYKNALEFDILLLEAGYLNCELKKERLEQVENYIEAVQVMRYRYGSAVSRLMTKASNLYQIQLRPRNQDPESKVVEPVFNIIRGSDHQGIPKSSLFNAMYEAFPGIKLALSCSYDLLIKATLDVLSKSAGFEGIQNILSKQCLDLFGLSIDFKKGGDSLPITKDGIDSLMGFNAETTQKDYIDALLGKCASNIFKNIPAPLFYEIPVGASDEEQTEYLSILTQFFLSHITIYCKATGISTKNFGLIFDASPDLSKKLVDIVRNALTQGSDVEQCIFDFFNAHTQEFGLSHSLDKKDMAAIQQKFNRTYRAVTATDENPHMDDFMILDTDATPEGALFFTHQGSICVDFAKLVDAIAASANPAYFKKICEDSIASIEIPHENKWVSSDGLEINYELLNLSVNDNLFQRLPDCIKDNCRAHPSFQVRQFLHYVAQGNQVKAEFLLTFIAENAQVLLRSKGIFTDYSKRIFNCTAYEYAYWAKDTHMCRMLNRYMDEETKAQILAHIDEMENKSPETGQEIGLTYQQYGVIHRSAHFDFTPLKEALINYANKKKETCKNFDYLAIPNFETLVLSEVRALRQAQHNLPAHVVHEYCREDRSFSPEPTFNEAKLLRNSMTFIPYIENDMRDFFSLSLSTDLVLVRGSFKVAVRTNYPRRWEIEDDFFAIESLDKARTIELGLLRENLMPTQPQSELPLCSIF